MFQPHLGGSDGRVFRLHRIDRARHAGLDVTKRAGPRANIAQNHHGGVLFRPALTDIGAGGFLAHGVEVQFTHQPPGFVIPLTHRSANADPVRLSLTCGAIGDRSCPAI